jgi:ArsR family transcriptional regulator
MMSAVGKALSVIDCCSSLAAEKLDEGEAEATAELFKALAEPARVRIVNRLAQSEEPVCACEFPRFLGLSLPTASHHLSKLTRAGLLNREQRGKWAYFSLDPEAAQRLAGIVRLQEVVS